MAVEDTVSTTVAGDELMSETDWDGAMTRRYAHRRLTMPGQSRDAVAWCQALGPWLKALYVYVHERQWDRARVAILVCEVKQRKKGRLAAEAWSIHDKRGGGPGRPVRPGRLGGKEAGESTSSSPHTP